MKEPCASCENVIRAEELGFVPVKRCSDCALMNSPIQYVALEPENPRLKRVRSCRHAPQRDVQGAAAV